MGVTGAAALGDGLTIESLGGQHEIQSFVIAAEIQSSNVFY